MSLNTHNEARASRAQNGGTCYSVGPGERMPCLSDALTASQKSG